MAEQRLSLAAATSPLFLYLSTFWRSAASSRATQQEVKEQLLAIFEKIADECRREPRLAPLYERIHYALVAAADQIVLSSTWPERTKWALAPLEKDLFKKLEGGKRFFRLVDEVLQEPTAEAAEIAECLFQCIALGFRGELIGEKRELERMRRSLFEKARLAGALGNRLTPDASDRTVPGRPVTLPTTRTLRLVALAVASLVFLLLTVALGVKLTDEDLVDSSRFLTEELRAGRTPDLNELPDTLEPLREVVNTSRKGR